MKQALRPRLWLGARAWKAQATRLKPEREGSWHLAAIEAETLESRRLPLHEKRRREQRKSHKKSPPC
jgi:hypothetical protein